MTPAKAATAPVSMGLPKIGAAQLKEMGVPIAVLAIIIALITPLPSFMLDGLIVLDIMVSVIVLMVAMYIRKPVEFSVFPTALLLLTLFRLALNISSTRLILMNGNSGTTAAGEVIEAFGQFVVGGNYIIGTVIFLVLIAIQYVVINHGAVRISEVTARFTLDALPGKQMSIDADLNAGLIDENEARSRRKMLAAEAEFYGAMDGASRFTQRDAIASVLITAINVIAGFLIGVLQHGMELRKAIETYTVLTIGDGLVTVIPALMISISGGLIVTRAGSDGNLGADFHNQLFNKQQPLMLASGVLVALAMFPGLPTIPFLVMGGGIGTVAWRMRKTGQVKDTQEIAAKPAPAKENVEALLRVEPLAVEFGMGLVRLIEGAQDSALLRRISSVRRQLAIDLGYVLPPVKVTDNVSLKSNEYIILLKGAEIARYELPQGQELAIPVGKVEPPPDGRPTKEPAFGMQAWWIPAIYSERAQRSGFTVVDSVSVLGTHLSELVRRYAHELFSRQDTKKFLDRVGAENPKLIEDLTPKQMSASLVQRVLQNLLREQVCIRDATSICEALAEAVGSTRNAVLLTEYVRQSIRRTLVKPYLNTNGELTAYLMDPAIERALEGAVEHGEHNSHIGMDPTQIRDITNRIMRRVGTPEAPVAIIAGSGCRYFLRQLLETANRNIVVISHNEIPAETKVISLGNIQ